MDQAIASAKGRGGSQNGPEPAASYPRQQLQHEQNQTRLTAKDDGESQDTSAITRSIMSEYTSEKLAADEEAVREWERRFGIGDAYVSATACDIVGDEGPIDSQDMIPEFEPTVSPGRPEQRAAYRKRVEEEEERARLAVADISETEFTSDGEDEAYLDSCRSPLQYTCRTWTPAYQAKRDSRKRRLPSPPATPPHLKSQKTLTTASGISKSKRNRGRSQKRRMPYSGTPYIPGPYTPRRPLTRSSGCASISLSKRKGMVVWQPLPAMIPLTISYEKYLMEYDTETIRLPLKEREKLDLAPTWRATGTIHPPSDFEG